MTSASLLRRRSSVTFVDPATERQRAKPPFGVPQTTRSMSGFPPDQIPASLQPSGAEPLSGTCPTGAPDVQVQLSFVKILRPLRQVWGLVARSCIGAVLVLP